MKLYLAHGFLTRKWALRAYKIQRERERELRLHLAERDPQHHAWPKRGTDKENMKLRILLSYHYYKDTDLDALFAKYFTRPYPDVFADSGAFSAMTQGIKITCAEYATWVKRWQHLFSVYANLDVIKDADATWKNQIELEDKHGIEPIPAFHILESFDWLERYVDRYSYIALGVAGQQAKRDAVMRWLLQCFKIAGKQSVFHGFALTSWNIMNTFRWYSVDSSSWGSGFRFGTVPLFDERRGKFVKGRLGKSKDWKKHASLVRSLGFSPLDFADRERNDRAKICAISALSYMKAEQWLRRRHGEVKIPNRGDVNSGPNLHLADTSNGINWSDADKGVKLHLADARGHTGSDLAAAETGLKLHLAEHSLDRGG